MRLAFMGTPDFSVPTLKALVAAGHDIAAVYTQPPRPAGRGKADRKSPVHLCADALGLAVRCPQNFRGDADRQAFAALGLDAAIVVAYGLILPLAILEAPKLGCLNIHASLLPRWRGAAPIHRAVMAGDRETGVGVMQMEKGLDTGPVWAEARTPIGAQTTTADLHDRLADMGAELLVDTLPKIASRALTPMPQAEAGVTYAHKIDKAEAKIDWTEDAATLDRQVRGLSPFPGAFTEICGERVKILAGRPVAVSGTPGTVLDDDLTIACGTGAYRPSRLQRAGKAPMERSELLRGFPVPIGSRVG